jgi:protein MAK16
MFDKRIWDAIGNKKTCSFKLDTKLDTLCKNEYNVTGICNEFSCPLANTKYATVRSIGEEMFLFVKEPERCHTPNKMYEKIKLSSDYQTALKEIEEHLEFWDAEVIHKCKQRMTKLTEYHERLEYLKEHGDQQLAVRKTKMNRREKIRALRALNSINFEKEIGNELLMRLEAGIYGEENKEKYETAIEKEKKKKSKRFVTDFEESAEVADIPKKKKRKKEKKKQVEMNW